MNDETKDDEREEKLFLSLTKNSLFVPKIISASSAVLALTSISWVYRAERASLTAGSKGTMAGDTSRAMTLRLDRACFFLFL